MFELFERTASRLHRVAGLFLLGAIVAASLPQQTSGQDRATALTEDQKIVHVLNRLGYGPRPGDIDRVRAMGIESYIEAQLNPEQLRSPRLEELLATYPIPYSSREALIQLDRPAVAFAVRQRQSVMERAAARGQSRTGTDITSRERLREHVRNGVLGPELTRVDRRWEDNEYFATVYFRAIYAESQLEEMLVDFWFNHFNITSGEPFIHADYGENVIRRHAMGRFEDLLIATATHPGMLIYLDNWVSTAPKEVVEERLASWEPPDGQNKVLWRRQMAEYFDQAGGLNENYGRELMELHTLGADGGYTQQDVQEVAKAFTGWTLEGGRDVGDFRFNPLLHVEGDKTVLGQTIASGGIDEGMQILRMLARHPSTAHFVSSKLVRRFVADEPPAEIVEAAAERFLETDGDIREVLRAIFFHPDFFAPEHFQAKVKKPIEVVVSAVRAVDADIESQFMGANINQYANRMGEQLRQHEAPDGYPDVASAWVSTNSIFQRFLFAMEVATESIDNMKIDLDAARELFQQMGFPEPTPEQVAQAQELFAAMQSEDDEAGAGGPPGMMAARGNPNEQGDDPEDRAPVDYDSLEAKTVSVALVLGSPDFQKR